MKHGLLFIDIRDRALYAVAYPAGSARRARPTTKKLALTGDDRQAALDQALARMAREVSWDHTRCHISLPGPWIAYRNMAVPFREHRKIKQVLPFEMEPLLPGSIDDYRYTFYTVEWDAARRMQRIIAAAGRRDVVDPVLASLRDQGLEVAGLHASGMALALCLARQPAAPPARTLLLLDQRRLELYGVADGALRAVRTCGLHPDQEGTPALLARYARQLAVNLDGTGAEHTIPDIAVFDRSREGRGPLLDGIQAAMADHRLQSLNGEVWQAAKPDQASAPPESDRGFEGAFAMATARMRRLPQINFLEETFNTVFSLQAYRPQLMRVGLLAFLAAAMFLVNMVVGNHALTRQTNLLQQRQVDILRTAFPDTQRIVDPRHQMRTRVDQAAAKARPLKALLEKRPKLDLLKGIVQSIPDEIDLVLSRMMLGEDRIIIQGTADDFDGVNRIRDNLEKWDAVRAATISSANLEQGQQRVRFQLTIETRPVSAGASGGVTTVEVADTVLLDRRDQSQGP